MPFDVTQVNWVLWSVVLVVIVVGWTILRVVLRLSMRIFSLGCVGLVVLVGIIALAGYLTR